MRWIEIFDPVEETRLFLIKLLINVYLKIIYEWMFLDNDDTIIALDLNVYKNGVSLNSLTMINFINNTL